MPTQHSGVFYPTTAPVRNGRQEPPGLLRPLAARFDGFRRAAMEGAYILGGLAAQLLAQKVAAKIVVTVNGLAGDTWRSAACF